MIDGCIEQFTHTRLFNRKQVRKNMKQIENGIVFEDSYLGVTVGALIFSQGTILIDAPIRPEDTRVWRSAVMTQRGNANRLLVSLDAHPDRTLGTRALECSIVSHQKAAQVFRNRPTIFKGQSVETGAAWETYSDAIGMRWAAPDITFTEQVSLHWGMQEVILEHHPGPTPGSMWVILPAAKIMFVGDSLVTNQPPFLAQAEVGAWIESLELLIKAYASYTIVCGRGGLASIDDVRNLRKLLKDVLQSFERLAGKNAQPEATQDQVASLLSRYTFAAKLHELYATRLTYGLHQCFARRYRPTNVIGQPEVEEDEQ
jgi:glyoxylase-like metal-dependent hydrolase (beta-lactamase superfamily II)